MKKQNYTKTSALKRLVILTCLLVAVTIKNSFAQISVTATAGTVGPTSYGTLKLAFDAVNAGTHQGAITIDIVSNSTEGTTPATLNSSGAGSASYTSVNIRPVNDGVSVSGNPVTGFGVIQLNGADNVTIDGDNPNTGSINRNLTVSNTTTTTVIANSAIRIATSAAVTSADNNTIKNCVLLGNVTGGNLSSITSATGSSNSSFGIYVGGNGGATSTSAPTAITSVTTNTAPVGTTINTLLINNNAINQCARAIVFNGAATSVSTGVIISNNLIGDQATVIVGAPPYTSPSTTVYTKGIWVNGTNAVTISGNNLNNIMSYVATTISTIELAGGIGIGTISITGNTITNLTQNGSGSSTVKAILITASSGAYTVGGNIISNVQSNANASATGAIEVNVGAGTIERNKITTVHNRFAGNLGVYAINVTAGNNTTIKNNFVSDVKMDMSFSFSANFGTSTGIHAIRLASGTGHKVYHNSVSLFGTLFGTSTLNMLTSAFTITTTSVTGADVRNNVFSNTLNGGPSGSAHVSLFLPSGATSTLNLTLNNNAYYCGSGTSQGIAQAGTTSGTNFYLPANFNSGATTPSTNLRAYTSTLSVAGTNDNATFVSASAAPFTSASDLHIPAATSTQLESAGATTTVTTDIDADTRPGPVGSVNGGASAPDIGADEFDGIIVDLSAPLISYTALSGTCSTTDRTLTATITDASGVPTAGALQPRIYYKKNAGTYFSSQGVLATGSGTNGTWTFTIAVADMGGVAVGDIISYFIIAQDIAGTPNISSNPSGVVATDVNTVGTPPASPASYLIQTTLNGSYTVGIGQNYTTLTSAVFAYNNSCLSGAVTFVLTDASYPSETFPIAINANPFSGPANTLTIVPGTGVAATITGSSTTAILKMYGADYITVDGLNTGGSSLSISNSDAVTTLPAVFWIASPNTSDGATHITISNCFISGNMATTYGLIAGSSISPISQFNSAESPNSFLTVQSCSFKKLKTGIYVNGNASSLDANNLFTLNSFGSAIAADKLSATGILVQQVQNVTISNNVVNGIISGNTTTALAIGIFGSIATADIFNNRISDIRNTNTGAPQGCQGIHLAASTTSSNVKVYNNFIWDLASFGQTGFGATANAWGILMSGGGGYNVYFNTVLMGTNQTAATSTTAALNIISSVTSINVVNNILANTQTVGTSRYSVVCGAAPGIFTSINYNDYYITAGNLVGRISSTDQPNLAAWQGATGQDANSQSINPSFVSTTDLHLITSSSPLDNSGVNIPGITTDIDGDSRPATPDMGADEFTFANNNCTGTPTPGSIQNSFTLCPAATTTLNVTGYTQGVLGITFQWEESDDNGGTDPWANAVGGTGSTTIAYTTPGSVNNIYYRCKVTCSFSGLFDYTNACTITITPFTIPEDFSSVTFPPSCWTRNDATYIFRASSSAYGSGTGSAEFNFYSATYQANLDLTTPAFTPFPSGYLLYFDHAYATYSGEIDSLVILYSTNGGSSYNTLIVYQGGTSGPLNTGGTVGNLTQFVPTAAQWASKLVTLPNGTNRIIFRGKGNFGNNLYIDNINFLPPAPCDAPATPSASIVTATSADISWTCTGCTGAYQLDYGTNGHVAGTGTLISAPSSPYTLNPPLVPNTAYTVYVRQDCGVYGFSSWSSGVNFTTLCAPPQPQVLTNAPICSGFNLTFSGNNLDNTQSTGNLYSWSGPAGFSSLQQNPVINGATTANTGTYTLTVTNQYGCTASASTGVSVNPNPVLVIASQTNVSCNGELDGEVDIDATSGTSPFVFDLDGLPTLDGIYTGLGAGTYTATCIDDAGCEATAIIVTITEPDVLTVTAGSNTPVCPGTPLNLTSTPMGGTTAYGYAWTGPNGAVPAVQNPTIASATAADAGQYDLTLTDANGCTATASHTVFIYTASTAPTSVTSDDPDNEICSGQNVLLSANGGAFGDAPGASYKWYEGGCGTGSVLGSASTLNVISPTAGSHTYYVRIEDGCGNTSCSSITILVTNAPPGIVTGTFTGPSYACSGTVSLITVNPVSGSNIHYSWNIGTNSSVVLFSTNIGGPFSAGPFSTPTNQVYAQFGTLGAGHSGYYVCVQGVNSCGSTTNRCLSIRGTVSGPGLIAPADPLACPNDVKNYTCGASTGATVYNWTLSGSATPITSGQGTTAVTVTFPPAFTTGQLCVTAALACGGSSTSPPRCMTISTNPASPSAITGPVKVCPGATGVPFSVSLVTGATGYNWTVPSGCTIATGTGTNAITVNFPNPYTGAPSICVTATGACGTSVQRCKTVGTNIPSMPGNITGPNSNICNSTVQYSIANVSGATGYTWTNPAGTTLTAGQGSTTILLSIGSAFTTGTLSVTANTSLCTPGISTARTITIVGKPSTPGTITASPGAWCAGGFVNFSIAAASPLPTYTWFVATGTIDAGQGSNNIDVTWGAGAGNVNVTASNSCGASGTRSQSFSSSCREEEELSTTDNTDNFAVYPNPAHDHVTVSIYMKEAVQFNIKLRDLSGRVILSEDRNGSAGLNTYDMELKNFAKGLYTLEVQSADKSWKSKVVIQ